MVHFDSGKVSVADTLAGMMAAQPAHRRRHGLETETVLLLCSVTRKASQIGYTTKICRGAFAAPCEFTVILCSVQRLRSLTRTDNHRSGPHMNVVWLDPVTQLVRRFDPYYAAGVADCDAMQDALDAAVSARCTPCGWRLERWPDALASFPYGPQLIEACSKQRRGLGEDFCSVWSIAVALQLCKLHARGAGTSCADALAALYAAEALPTPQTPEAVLVHADAYLAAARRLAAPCVAGRKRARCSPREFAAA
jgi:hypothetical protein